MGKPKINYAKREIIEGRLLAALDDEDKVAIVASKEDLAFLIKCVGNFHDRSKQQQEMLADLTTLHSEAFWDETWPKRRSS